MLRFVLTLLDYSLGIMQFLKQYSSQIFSLRVNHNIIHGCVINVFELIRDYRDSVAHLSKFLIVGVFFVHGFYGFQYKEVLRTCGNILGIAHYDPDNIFQ